MPNSKITMLLAFGTSVAGLLIIGITSYRGLSESAESSQWATHSHEVIENVDRLISSMEQNEFDSLQFVLTSDPLYRKSYDESLLKTQAEINVVKKATVDNADQQSKLVAIEGLVTSRIHSTDLIFQARQKFGLAVAIAEVRSGSRDHFADQIHQAVAQFQAEENRLSLIRQEDIKRRLIQTKTNLLFGTFLCVLATISAGWIVIRGRSARRIAEIALQDSEEKYRMLLDGVHDYAIFMLDPQGVIVSWSAGAERIKGYTAEEIIGKHLSVFFTPDDIERGIPKEVLRIAGLEGRHEARSVTVRKDGTQFMSHSILTTLLEPDGHLHGFSGISRDFSEAENSEVKYRALLEAAPDAMVVVDEQGDIVLLNLQAEKQFDYRRDELVGQKVTSIIPEGFAERIIADGIRSPAEALAQQIGMGIELNGRRKDGTEFPIEIMLSPLGDAKGILFTAAIRDISVRKKADEHLAQMEAKYRGLLEAAPDAMVVVNQSGVIVLLNAEAENQFGYRRDELVGQRVTNIIPEGFAERLIADGARTAAEALAQHIGTGIELIGVRKDGTGFPIEIMLSPLQSTEGILVTAAIRDISVRKSAEQHLAQMESRYRGLLEAAPDAMVVVNQSGEIVLLNVEAENQFGYRRDELLGHSVTDIVPEGFAERIIADALRSVEEATGQQIGTGIELYGRRKDDSQFPIEIMLSPLGSSEGILITAAIRNITARKKVEAALDFEQERAQITLNCMGDAIACTDGLGNISFLNVAAEVVTGWSLQEATGKPLIEIFPILDALSRKLITAPQKLAIEEDSVLHLPLNSILIRRDGSEVPIEDSIAPIHDRDGNPAGAVIVFRDVSAARSMALQIVHAAEHDFLTGLPNRLLLNDRIRQAIARAHRNEERLAVMFLDLDGFKHINDSLGHPIGDKLLQSVSTRLLSCVRASDTVSRQGGDEFVVLLTEIEHPKDSTIATRRILDSIAEAYSIEGNDLHITTSIGVSIYPEDGLDAETLLKNADTAMYRAKDSGRQSCQFFEAAMNVQAVERQSIEESLRRALQREEFILHYQPKIDVPTGKITGAEALIRWIHPMRGLVSPAQFIPIAEDCGLMLPISRWVLREACRQSQAWIHAGLPPVSMAVNLSAMDFRDENFLSNIFTILDETNMDPCRLELELTESVLMKRAEAAEFTLQALRARGILVAVDDFGTGYSSLSYLRQFSIDALKIDQSFIRQLSITPDETTIVTAMINMGRSLKLRVVAEGVETLQELEFLQAAGCDEAQGYYFSRPVHPDEFAKLLREDSFKLAHAR